MSTVNRDLRVPLYHQVKTSVLQEIEAGRWKPDDQLPIEDELIARFQVSKVQDHSRPREHPFEAADMISGS